MAFSFDVERAAQEAQKRRPAPANPANSANPTRQAKRISSFSGFSNTNPTAEELSELTRLIHELAQLEGWTEQELARWIWERNHMALANVRKALHALRIARDAALAPWPTAQATRSGITLCELVELPKKFRVIEGGGNGRQPTEADRNRDHPEAA